ncbi:MAG: FAD-dependent oxidoreductase [Opitutaceae bacterium]
MVIERGIDLLLHARVVAATVGRRVGWCGSLSVATAGGLIELGPSFVVDASGACVVPVLTGFPVMSKGEPPAADELVFHALGHGPAGAAHPAGGMPALEPRRRNPDDQLTAFQWEKREVKTKVVDGRGRWIQPVGRGGVCAPADACADPLPADRRLPRAETGSPCSRAYPGASGSGRSAGSSVEHMLTEAEARRAAIFPDAVAVNTYHIDFHWPDRMQRAGTGITDMLDPHHLPLRMMIPRGRETS